MPKHGKGGKFWKKNDFSDDLESFKKDYFEHDNRGSSGEHHTRRVSFKGGNRITKHGRQREPAVRINLDHDVDMDGSLVTAGSSGRGGRYVGPYRGGNSMRRGRGGRVVTSSSHGGHRPRLFDQTGWFRVHIPFGSKHEKSYLIKILQSHLSSQGLELIPISFKYENQDAMFFVDNLKVAEALLDADRRITTINNSKLQIKVTIGMPRVDMNDVLKERIKQVMGKRYNVANKALDLSYFHRDPDLSDDTFCAASRPQVVTAFLDIIKDNIPDLVALNLDNNGIYTTENLASLAIKAPNLRILHLGSNRLRDLNSLSGLKGLQLLDLKLEGNPLCRKFDVKSEYSSSIRKLFPKLTKLDNVDLPPQITFEEEEQQHLPPTSASFLCQPSACDVVRQFVEMYFSIYDCSGNATRQQLLEAYHEEAILSLTSLYPPSNVSGNQGAKLNTYISESRNLLRTREKDRRDKMLHYGKLGIVSFLDSLPKTQHDPSSFTLDLTICSANLMCATLTGVFREPNTKGVPLRHFMRKFILVPMSNGGFSIVNEMMFVTNASVAETKKAFSNPPVPVPVPTPASPAHALGAAPVVPENQKETMIAALSTQTGMNVQWSRKCLDETGWDLPAAMNAFIQLNAMGKVPAEAFLK